MSNLPGNPHAQKFADTEAMAEGKRYSPEIARVIQAAQQMEATMALAYEQRTANLIALWASPGNLPDGSYDKGMEMSGVNYGDLANQIKTRLGLGANND